MGKRLPRGFSFQINGGSYGGFYVNFTRLSWRVCLGWAAITLFLFDIEPVIHIALNMGGSEEKMK